MTAEQHTGSGARGQEAQCVATDDDLRAFLLVLRRALLSICAYIERRYLAPQTKR